jgi:hypothetical protein
MAPKYDGEHPAENVREIVTTVSGLYRGLQAADKLSFELPNTYSHFPDSLQRQMASWLLQQKSSLP